MALIERNTPWRDPVKHVIYALIKAVLRAVVTALRPRRHPHIKELNDHQRRDIGATPGALATFDHRLPSQHTHHPRG